MPDRLVAAAQPGDERNRQQHHPGLADDLSGQEVERTEGEPQEHDGVDHEPDEARCDHGGDQPAARERRIDREIGELGQQERRRRGDHQRRRRDQRRERRTGEDRAHRDADAEPPLHQIAQHQRDADHHDARRRHQARRHRDEARAVRHAYGAGVADQPVGGRNGQREQDQEHDALAPTPAVELVVASACRPSTFANPSARSRQAGQVPQP